MGKSNSRYRSLTFIPSILVKSTRLPSRASALGHKRPLNSLAVEGLLSARSGHSLKIETMPNTVLCLRWFYLDLLPILLCKK